MTKILLVEDDKSLREIYGVRLFAEGYDIVSAGDGEEALAIAIKERPQLIVSDVMMPKISGFDMLDILRSTTETKDIKVIMMTALSSDDQRARGEQLGADRYLVKSQVGIEDVVRTVHDVLGDAPVSGNADTAQIFSRPTPRPPQQQGSPVPQRPTEPARPQAPAYPPQPAAQPVAAPAPAAPVAQQAPSGLPQPTAPFSSQRPANLGDRIIHPIAAPENPPVDVSTLMDKELLDDEAAQPTVAYGSEPAKEKVPEQPAQQPVQSAQPVFATPTPPPAPPVPPTPPIQAAGAVSYESMIKSDDNQTPPSAPQPPVAQ
ncbi:hypothetical protein B7Z17_00895 [Candidatus Saccharibacteria bacterium 32-49-10]|nr:MAG: hypothetical protein B7Z17_00895 [Candidatus Saccharibacteria bacterium 32-49-10]